MADKPINKLPAATTVYDTDLFVLDQGGTAKKMTGEMFRKYFLKVAGGHGGVSSIAKVSSAGLVDTYRITYADGETYDFQVHNGKSIVSVEKTDSLFVTDTYTITYNDGTTSEFYVKNGTNAEIDIKYATSTSEWVNTGEWSDQIPPYNAADKYLWAQITITNGLDITKTEGVVGIYGEDAYESAKKGGFEGTKEEFEKKLAEGLISEERVNELIEEKAPDWNANEGEPGYIKNRPFYEVDEENIVTRELDGNAPLVDAEFCELLFEKKLEATYFIEGEQYAYVGYDTVTDDGWSYQITNGAKFFLVTASKSKYIVIDNLQITDFSGNPVPGIIKFQNGLVRITHELDAKYLPMDDIVNAVISRMTNVAEVGM